MFESRPSIPKSDESRVIEVDDTWEKIKMYYFSVYRGDEKQETERLRHALRHYDVLKDDRCVKTGKYIRYMQKSFVHPRLMPKCIVVNCKPNVIKVTDLEKKKEWIVPRTKNIIFVNRKTRRVNSKKKKQDKFRVMLEQLSK